MIKRMVSNVLATFAVISVLLCNGSSAQYYNQLPNVPCPNLFEYAYDGNTYIGIITLRDLTYGQTTVQVEMTQPGALNSDYSGKLSLNFNKDKIFDYIQMGRPVTYRVDFPLQNVIPRITSIVVNNVRVCSGPRDGPPSATINLEHTLRTYSTLSAPGPQQAPVQVQRRPSSTTIRRPSQQIYQPTTTEFRIPSGSTFGFDFSDFPEFLRPVLNQPTYSQTPTQFSPEQQNPFLQSMMVRYPETMHRIRPSTGQTPMEPPTQPPRQRVQQPPRQQPQPSRPVQPAADEFAGDPASTTYINRVCGKENNRDDVQGLAVNGEVIAKSRFPWIVAIYTRKAGGLTFQCGGSLISSRSVISAAHCFQQGSESIQPEALLLSMGRHNLNDWQNAVNVEVQRLIKHPDFKPSDNFDADIAIVQLKTSVSFSLTIRPVCLWQGPIDVNAIEGTAGIVVGWGVDETNTGVTSVPKLVNTTIVSELTCIRSNERFYYITSNRTLCAGNLDGSGPCMGDSGSGLMIRSRNKWMLRGTVSASLSSAAHQCNLDEYVVYSDIAKFIGWIKGNMLF